MYPKYNYDVTFIVATYNQSLMKILLTVNSILFQEGVSYKIIIADDCSIENHFKEIKHHFELRNYKNYELLSSEKNMGTVFNYFRSMDYCNSEYVKFISPGDALLDKNSIKKWIEWTKSKNAKLSFCNAIYYETTDAGNYKCIKEHTYPQNIDVFKDCNKVNKQLYYQVMCNDYWLGAATLIETAVAKKYLSEINGIIKYGEDSIYRLMAYDLIKRCHYPDNAILYECDTGISSLGDRGNKWHRILMDEWYQTSLMILKKMNNKCDRRRKKFEAMINWKNKSSFRGSKLNDKNIKGLFKELFPLYLKFPGLFFWHIRTRVFERVSHIYSDELIQKKIALFLNE